MKTFEDLPPKDQALLRSAAARNGAEVSQIYTRPRPASEWEPRARLAAEWLRAEPELLDIGCGSMTLRRMLPPTIRYQGVDIVQRDEDTIVIDLNREQLPAFGFKIASALGVMEYLYEPDAFLASLRQFDRVVFSYCLRTLRLPREARLERLWVNHLTRSELREAFGRARLQVVKEKRLSYSERLFLLA